MSNLEDEMMEKLSKQYTEALARSMRSTADNLFKDAELQTPRLLHQTQVWEVDYLQQGWDARGVGTERERSEGVYETTEGGMK
jgi:hypothetical protein